MVNKMIYVYFSLYIILINIVSFLMMYFDKQKAKKGKYRISEKALFIAALLLGGIGAYIGMYKFRHKTKHNLFTIGMPIMIVLNILTVYYILANDLLIKFFSYLK